MKYPTLPVRPSSREMVDVFRGYNHALRIGEGEFYDMENLSSASYPVLAPRGGRKTYAEPKSAQGLIAKDSLCYVDGTNFVMNEYRVDMGLSVDEEDCPKTLVSMGAYVIILPDKKYINTLDLTDHGNIEASYTSSGDVTFELCNIGGEAYANTTVSASEPEKKNMALWIDTSSTPHTLKQYSESSAMWVSIATTYVKIRATGVGAKFEQYDGVAISGIKSEALQDLNATMTVWAKDNDYIVVTGILDEVTTQTAAQGAVTVERRMPNMDFVTEAGNRLWGCRYGVAANGAVVNEIYACKLGDFKNWNSFMGVSTDSWVASVGTDGQFTGAVTHLGYPVFFKETCLHKVYISSAGAHQIQDTSCRGVQKGCHRSLAIVNEVLYYKARSAVCAYDGSLPVEISAALGEVQYGEAAAGGHGNLYYISMKDAENYHMFCYDTAKNMWHREDNTRADAFCACRGELYYIDHKDGHIKQVSGGEGPVRWMAETGLIGITLPDQKYVSRLLLRAAMEVGATASVYGQYDSSGVWEQLCALTGTSLRSFLVPVRPKRCDHMRLRIEGEGDIKLYSITKTIEQGSDIC
ncbi:MAG: hypothetical protein IKV99_00530 [Oscillospiraceae bacterium]|nr:hypothetical protein [Oscillospiraceae bacterium]